MESERRKRGYTSGLIPPNIGDNFYKIKEFIDKAHYENYITGLYMPVSRNKIKQIVKEFYNLAFKLHDVCILPEINSSLLLNYLEKDNKTTEMFLALVKEFTVLASPFYIPLECSIGSSGGYCLDCDGLDESKIPLINCKIIIFGPSKLSIGNYASAISGTQMDTIRGNVDNFHDRDIINTLIEKILTYEYDISLFCDMEKFRILAIKFTMQKLLELGNANPQSNYLWSALISSIKAEELFDYYVNASNEGKKQIFADVQKIFDGEMTMQQLINKMELTVDYERAIPAMKRNLSIK